MRGKVEAPDFFALNHRITPAYAGKRDLPQQAFADCKDHPRICGEKLLSYILFIHSLGSPPHMRGKVGFGKAHWCIIRITPAYAGKSKFGKV